MQSHRATDDSPSVSNTRIGNKPMGIYGGKYYVSDSEYNDFLALYCKHTIVDGNQEYLTEIQPEKGIIAVDLDLHYTPATKRRQHCDDHINALITSYVQALESMFTFDETPFNIYVMQKPDINPVKNAETGAIEEVKDGIHMLIEINADRKTQMILRDRVMALIQEYEIWTALPLTNDWNGVFDASVSKGNAPWQLYGSCKPAHQAYRLTHVYKCLFDPADGEMSIQQMSLADYFDVSKIISKLSVRANAGQTYPVSPEFAKICGQDGGVQKQKTNSIVVPGAAPAPYFGAWIPIDAILNIRSIQDLDAVMTFAMEQLEARDYELLETHKYTMCLPEQYYGAGSYDKWIRVGWALYNTCPTTMFLTWVAFSAQSRSFKFSDISELYDRWQRFGPNNPAHACLTRRSIMHWAKQDAYSKFKEVQDSSVDYFIEKSINGNDFDLGEAKSVSKDTSDHDIACALKQLYCDQYVCVNIKNNIWYRFMNHRWVENDSGTTLRRSLSDELRKIYRKKSKELDTVIDAMMSADETDPRIKKFKKRQGRICEIINRLGDASDKDRIMKEAKELFWDQSIIEKLDTNPYLMCFNNGVIDFKEKVFRRGYPEDYISKSTCIDYIPINDTRDKDIIAEVNDFMSKLFPREELRRYMWEHLASVLIGIPKQTFHMYLGDGRNGKSVLTTLLDLLLGEYKGVVPLSAITQDRQKIGGTSAELVVLKGVRYAVIMEPSKKDVILEGPLKQLTSGLDPIQCRAPYIPKPIEFYPQFTLVCCSNVRMEIKTQDFGTWRRVREVPFEALFTENPVSGDPEKPYQFMVDPEIDKKFDKWKYVFMAMLVQTAFKTDGKVGDCSIVTAASKAYQESQDFLAEFIRDKVVAVKDGRIKKQELNSEFTIWYMNTYGKGAPSPKEVHAYMDKKFGKAANNGGMWIGARIKYERDDMVLQAFSGSASVVSDDGEQFQDNIDL